MGCRASCSLRRVVVLSVAVAAALSVACGGTSISGPSAVNGRHSFTVMTFNVQHGLDANGHYDLQGAIDVISRLQPDLVGVQELTRNHPAYNCDDQPALIAEGLQRATGQRWTSAYVREWFTPDHSCLDRGAGTDVETEGLAVFSPALGSTQDLPLFNTRIGIAARATVSPGLPVVVTQLASGTSATGDRLMQLGQLLPWAATQGIPRILVGDFNSRPGTPEVDEAVAQYHDAWVDAMAQGVARGVMTGDTRVKGGRIDYVFYTPSPDVQVDSAEIVDTTILLGGRVEVSDHRPVIVRFSTK